MKIIGSTDPGRVRSNNEDWFVTDEAAGLAVLADGMGGMNAGEVASREAAEVVLARLRERAAPGTRGGFSSADLEGAVLAANRHVFGLAKRDPDLANMGTTLVVWALVDPARCLIAHIGDSRAYRWRDARLEAVTRDHSLVQQLLDQGLLAEEEARTATNRHVITRAVGIDAEVQTEISELDIRPGDIYLLCSDGLSDMLSDAEIGGRIAAVVDGNELQAVADALVSAANGAGGKDNVSVVLISL